MKTMPAYESAMFLALTELTLKKRPEGNAVVMVPMDHGRPLGTVAFGIETRVVPDMRGSYDRIIESIPSADFTALRVVAYLPSMVPALAMNGVLAPLSGFQARLWEDGKTLDGVLVVTGDGWFPVGHEGAPHPLSVIDEAKDAMTTAP